MSNLATNNFVISAPQVGPVSQSLGRYGDCLNRTYFVDNKKNKSACGKFVFFKIMMENNIFHFNGAGSFIQITETSQNLTFSTNSIRMLFNYYYEKWKEETKYQSSTDVIINDPLFNEIIALGKSAVPCIIEVLRYEPSLLIAALSKITGENPVKPEHRGRVKDMAADWIEWWDEKSTALGEFYECHTIVS